MREAIDSLQYGVSEILIIYLIGMIVGLIFSYMESLRVDENDSVLIFITALMPIVNIVYFFILVFTASLLLVNVFLSIKKRVK